MSQHRPSRIIATIGPASSKGTILRRMILAGVNVFRFNMSHGTQDEHAKMMKRLRIAAASLKRPVGILVDLQGPKVRTGLNEGGGNITLQRGETILISFSPRGKSNAVKSRPGHIVVDSPYLAKDLSKGDRILLDDGRMKLRVEKNAKGLIYARVQMGGLLKEHAGVNVPGPLTSLRAPTSKDRRDAAFAVAQGADLIALSFVQSPDDIRRLKRILIRQVKQKTGGKQPLLIAKIEKPAALEHLDEILDEVDGVMVARGDLGVELSLEKVPSWQKKILQVARSRSVYTITATEILQSMVQNPTPTRAEVSDIANAVLDGTDALMLSAETAVGRYPVDSVRVLSRVAMEADRVWLEDTMRDLSLYAMGGFEDPKDPIHAIARAAVDLAEFSGARKLVVFTLNGRTIPYITRHRPTTPILALTPFEETQRKLCLAWNTTSLILPHAGSVDAMMHNGLKLLRQKRLVRLRDTLVLVAGGSNLPHASNLLRLVKVESGK